MSKKHWVILLTTPLAVLLDQATKFFIHSTFRLYQEISVIPGYLNIIYVQNRGLIFGSFSDRLGPYSIWVSLAITVVALGIIVHLFFRTEDRAVLLPLALSMVLVGAIGNLIDRLHWGYVVDFIQLYYVENSPPFKAHYWPTFNVADIAITCGIILLLIDSFRPQREPAAKPKANPETEGGSAK